MKTFIRPMAILLILVLVGAVGPNISLACAKFSPYPPASPGMEGEMWDVEELLELLTLKNHPSHVTVFIRQYILLAMEEMQRTGIPASLTLAQAILESGFGTSALSIEALNFFGIKGSYAGESMVYKGDRYRRYKSVRESFLDHSRLLLEKGPFQYLLKKKVWDHVIWTEALQAIAYAEDPRYTFKILNIIDRYSLQRLDSMYRPSPDCPLKRA